MALAGVELETLVSEPDTLTTRPPLFLGKTLNAIISPSGGPALWIEPHVSNRKVVDYCLGS